VDRFGTEVCLALAAGEEPAAWLRAALPALPELMAASDSVASAVDRACVDRTEAALLAVRVGREFDVVVLRSAEAGGTARSTSPTRPCSPAAPGRWTPAVRPASCCARPTRPPRDRLRAAAATGG
jgi:hypothetical protein